MVRTELLTLEAPQVGAAPPVPEEYGREALALPARHGALRAERTVGTFAVHSESFALATSDSAPAFYDITDLVCGVVDRAGIAAGTLTASTRHTTCALIVQENEPLLLHDMVDRLRRFASAEETYRHNNFDVRTVNMCSGECANGHAHCQHLLLGAAVTLPVAAGELVLGLWQRLLLIELDRGRQRQFSIQVMGIQQ